LLPPVPDWDALHPFAAHFAIAFSFAAPVFVLLGMLPELKGRCFSIAALILMVLASAASAVSVSTGRDAARLAERRGDVEELMISHERRGERVRDAQMVLTAAYALLVLLPIMTGKEPRRRTSLAMHAAFVVLYAAVLLPMILWTGHEGGLLVHEHGIHALMPR
jgi:uncharacterized membrane protein